MAESMTDLREEQKRDVFIFRIRGRLDALSSLTIEKRVFEVIDKGSIKLLIDLSGVSYISSAGMRMLLSTTKKLRNLAGKMAVSGMTPNVMDVLKTSGFDHVLELFKTEEDAFRHL